MDKPSKPPIPPRGGASAMSPRALKRVKTELETEIKQAFLNFLDDCKELLQAEDLKRQMDEDLKYVSKELSKRKAAANAANSHQNPTDESQSEG